MSIVKLEALPRSEKGSRAARALRAAGYIPANLYSHGRTPTPLKLDAVKWNKALATELHLVMLDIQGQKPEVATLREIQRDPMTQEILHIDLLHVEMDEAVRFQVKVEYHGTPRGTREGGVTQVLVDHVEVECLPTMVPDFLSVDISHLGVGETFQAGQMELPEGVKLVTEPDVTLVSVAAVRLAAAATAAAEAAEGGEKEEGEQK